MADRTRVVIIGGGFGGLTAAKHLGNCDLDVTLIDRTNHHLFQPLLYQVASASLLPADIAWPLRTVMRSYPNVGVVLDEVRAVNRGMRLVEVTNGPPIPFEVLIAAPGSRHSYFGHDEWEVHAPGLKDLVDAIELRERMLFAFEKAERLKDSPEAHRYLTFVIVGGGATGVELAGALAEIGRKAMARDFRSWTPKDVKILLIEGGDRILPTFAPRLSEKAKVALEALGVTVMLNTKVQDVSAKGVSIGATLIETSSVVWAAGNKASPLLESLQLPVDGAGRALVQEDLSVPGDPWIFVIGDAAHCPGADGHPLPGMAPVAIQQGQYVARVIRERIPSDQRSPFHYLDRGFMAIIGRAKAIAQVGSLQVSGFPAWLMWCFVHIFFLIGFHNRVRVMSEWAWYYITFKPGGRLMYWRPLFMHLKQRAAESEATRRG